MTKDFLWGFPSFLVSEEADTTVAFRLVWMAVPPPHSTPHQPRGGWWLCPLGTCAEQTLFHPSVTTPEQPSHSPDKSPGGNEVLRLYCKLQVPATRSELLLDVSVCGRLAPGCM